MFKFAKGYSLKDMSGLNEGYFVYRDYSAIEANVSVEKIIAVLQHFIALHKEKMFLILSLPVNYKNENPNVDGVVRETHSDVYYIDACSQEKCIQLIEKYGELLINDGMNYFGFGCHESRDEIIVGKYNIVSITASNLSLYEGFFEEHGIQSMEPFISAWELISKANPGTCQKILCDGASVYDLPELLKNQGMYYAETRVD